MATAAKTGRPTAKVGDEPYPLSADEFQRIVDAEILPSDRRIYLWDGRLFEKMSKLQPHAIAQSKLTAALFRAVPPGWHISPENPLRVDTKSVPLPDMAVVRGAPDDYPKAPPHAGDLALLVEVMHTSRKKDLRDHLQAYAAAGVRAYWVVDLKGRVIRCFRQPVKALKVSRMPGYETDTRHGPGDSVELEVPGSDPVRIRVDDILPADAP